MRELGLLARHSWPADEPATGPCVLVGTTTPKPRRYGVLRRYDGLGTGRSLAIGVTVHETDRLAAGAHALSPQLRELGHITDDDAREFLLEEIPADRQPVPLTRVTIEQGADPAAVRSLVLFNEWDQDYRALDSLIQVEPVADILATEPPLRADTPQVYISDDNTIVAERLHAAVDVVFVVDVSGSMELATGQQQPNQARLDVALDFIGRVLATPGIGLATGHIGIVWFSELAGTLPSPSLENRTPISEATNRLITLRQRAVPERHKRGATELVQGLTCADRVLRSLPAAVQARPALIVVISDGAPSPSNPPAAEAELERSVAHPARLASAIQARHQLPAAGPAHRRNIDFVSVAVGDETWANEPASEPWRDHHLATPSTSDLSELLASTSTPTQPFERPLTPRDSAELAQVIQDHVDQSPRFN